MTTCTDNSYSHVKQLLQQKFLTSLIHNNRTPLLMLEIKIDEQLVHTLNTSLDPHIRYYYY